MPRYPTALLLFLFFSIHATKTFAQPDTRTGQLKHAIETAPGAKEKLQAVIAFCDEWESFSPDTLKKYADLVRGFANKTAGKRALILADYYQAAWLFQENKLDTAFTLISAVINRYRKAYPFDETYVKLYSLKGNVLTRTARMDELMQHNLELLKLSEKANDIIGMARGLLGVGNAKLRLKIYPEALVWYHKALGLMARPYHRQKLSFLYNNMAIVFYHLQKEDSALYYVRQGIRYSREDENLTNLANALFLYGGMLAEFHHTKEAEQPFKEAVEVRKRIGDVYYLINDMAQLALFYGNNQQPQKGIALCEEGLALAEKNGMSYGNINSLYEVLAKNYEMAGDYKNFSGALVKQLTLKDSFYKKNSAEALAGMQAKYDLQKKENIIIQQKLDLVRKNYWLYGSLLLLVVIVVGAMLLLRANRRKQQLKLRLVQQEEGRRAEQAIHHAEEAERKRIAADLHDSLGAYAASIAANIEQLNGQLPAQSKPLLQELRTNAKGIVSHLNDTIWVLKKDALSITAIGDRLKIFIQRLQSSYPDVLIDVAEDVKTDVELPPSQAFHLFQIIREAVINALKHSRCSQLIINIEAHNLWRFSIADNGQGFLQRTTLAEGGNGLLNMKQRAKDSGYSIQWMANTPRGTRVIIEPTTN